MVPMGKVIIVADDTIAMPVSSVLKRVEDGEPVARVARDLGLSYQAVVYHLKRHGYTYSHAARSWSRA